MRMKTLGMQRIKVVRMILKFGLAVALISIPAISAIAEGGGQVPYPQGGSPAQAAER